MFVSEKTVPAKKLMLFLWAKVKNYTWSTFPKETILTYANDYYHLYFLAQNTTHIINNSIKPILLTQGIIKFGWISLKFDLHFGIFVNTHKVWQVWSLLYGLSIPRFDKLSFSSLYCHDFKSQLKLQRILFNSSKELKKCGDNETASVFWSVLVGVSDWSNFSTISKLTKKG